MDTSRDYQDTHPWISFQLNLRRIPPPVWALLGRAMASADHIAHSMLRPDVGQQLHQLFLAKGVLATTAIEGNTLNEDDALRAVQGTLDLPESRQYLGQEIRNIIDAANEILETVVTAPEGDTNLTSDQIKGFNRMVLRDLPLEEDVVPGEIRTHSVGVARYRGAPPGDCEYLVDRLCEWLATPALNPEATDSRVPFAIIKAIVAHLYLAWIHPFGDGNGRTARLMEVQILLAAEMPAPACHLLSNHYNQTRSEYYRQLDAAGRSGDPVPFIEYAVRGLLDGLEEALTKIRAQQFEDRWEQYVYETFGTLKRESDRRRLRLVLDITRSYQETGEPVRKEDLRFLSPEVTEAYADKTMKTVSRDLNAILSMGLLAEEQDGYVPRDWVILTFRPERRDATNS